MRYAMLSLLLLSLAITARLDATFREYRELYSLQSSMNRKPFLPERLTQYIALSAWLINSFAELPSSG